ncbi:hypothetical protein R5R35_009829 [Gryllus longicercus]|uniref:CRAL-TRIO domain-containing protein n=1 Tax=Gryllus longicercus TaxID=2509291 RepID=A0AAN9VQ77_9ORTH
MHPPPALPLPPGPSLEESLQSCPRLKADDVQRLQEWLSKQPHLPRMSAEELVPFLHRAAYSLERAKAGVDAFWTLRAQAPEVFADRDPALPANRQALDFFELSLLPKPDAGGCPVVCMGFAPRRDLSAFDAWRAANACGALMEVTVVRHPTASAFVCVLDAAHLRLGHLTRAPPRLLHVLLAFIQQAVPVPMKAIHVINVHALVEKAMFLVKPFLGKELHRLLHFHSGPMEAFYAALPRDMLPKEFGGTSGSTAEYHQESIARLHKHKDWMLSLAARGADESKRPADPSQRSAFGIVGSFKKLEID